MIFAVIPFTLVAIMPINKKLLAPIALFKCVCRIRSPAPLWGIVATSRLLASRAAHKGRGTTKPVHPNEKRCKLNRASEATRSLLQK